MIINPYVFSAGFSAEAEAVFTNIETGSGETLSYVNKIAIARFVDSQVQDGNWTKMYALIPLEGLDTSAKARVNWITGTQAIEVGSPTYSASAGFTTSGTAYIRSQFTPSVGGGGGASVGLDDTAYHVNVKTLVTTGTMGVIGTNANGQVLISLTSGSLSMKHHTDSTIIYADVAWAEGLISIKRTTSLAYTLNRNTMRLRSAGSYTSEVVPNREIYIGCRNNNGTADSFTSSSYGVFLCNLETNFNYPSFWVNFQFMLMELGAMAKSALYPYDRGLVHYSASENLIINSEGQSNGLFAGAAAGPPPGPFDLVSAIPGVYTWWGTGGDPNATISQDQLDYGTNHSYDDLTTYAGGLIAMYVLQRLIDPTIIVWDYCISGSGLYSGDINGWYPTHVNKLFQDSNTGILADGIALVSGSVRKIIFHWNQGEADASASRTQQEYTDDFYLLLNTKINRLETNGIDFDATEFHVIVPQIFTSGAGSAAIKAAQAAFSIANYEAAYPAHAGFIRTWTNYTNSDWISTDGTHPLFGGYLLEGYRLGLYMSRL